MRGVNSIIAITFSLALCACLAGCSGGTPFVPPPPVQPPTNNSSVPNTATASGYTLTLWVNAPLPNLKPDSIIYFNKSIYIGYQKAGDVKDGSDPTLTNTVVQYDLAANILKQYTVPGHVDGLMGRSDTNELWAMANEDGNPELTIINLATGAQKTYQATVNPPLHGGGYDDMQLLNGVVYVSASNPTTPGAPPPTLVSLTLNPNGTTFDVGPVLAGDAMALDITPSVGGSPNPTYNTNIPLSLSDPDSLAIDFAGNIVLDSQADAKLVFIHSPGPNQQVSVLSLTLFNDKDGPSTPVDDSRWVPPAGSQGQTFMLFTDATNTTYRIDAAFTPGDVYSCAQGQVLKLDTKSGHLTPIAVSIGNPAALQDPHGMVFVAQ